SPIGSCGPPRPLPSVAPRTRNRAPDSPATGGSAVCCTCMKRGETMRATRGAARPLFQFGQSRVRPLVLAAALALAAAGAATAGSVEDARQRLGAGDAQGAYEILKPEERARAGTPEFDYTLG